jgi:predicted ribosome quality control (RQC) complex YloA/Tae2 family protein
MSLNYLEIELILKELPLENSIIQKVHQIGFNALLFELYKKGIGLWHLYVEVGTPNSRLNRVTVDANKLKNRKTKKLQRFIQYIRSHVESSRITTVVQQENDRLVDLHCANKERSFHLILRFYSASKANVIITDENYKIEELLFRRPRQNEVQGFYLKLESSQPKGNFKVREYPQEQSFNSFIENYYQVQEKAAEIDLITLVNQKFEKLIGDNLRLITKTENSIAKSENFDSYRETGNLLATYRHLITPNSDFLDLKEGEHTIRVILNPSLNASENIESYYQKYKKYKANYEHSLLELENLKERKKNIEQKKEDLREIALTGSEDEKKALLKQLTKEEKPKEQTLKGTKPPLNFKSGIFTIFVGRNAKENDNLLRKWVRGNDWWLHTRDKSGSYVFIKNIESKTIPLETILDAASLALLYSKVPKGVKTDLYYTQVKYLRRAKGAKLGTVIPTQEKNIVSELDQSRIERLFLTKNGDTSG